MKTNRSIKTRLLIDKIAFTVRLSRHDKDIVLKRFTVDKIYKEYNGRVFSDRNQRYNNNYQITVLNKHKVDVSMYPINSHHNFFRIEANPTMLKKEGRIKLRCFLIKALGLNIVKTIYFHAKVTRLDLTLDVFNIEDNLYIHIDRAVTSKIFPGKNGKPGSQIVGSGRSSCQVTMYDKNALRIKKGLKPIGRTYLRIECCLRDLRCSMHGLSSDLLKHLIKIKFYRDDFLTDKRFSESFLSDTISNGLNFAFKKCDRNIRLRYRRYIDEYRVYPFDVETLDFDFARDKVLKHLKHKEYEKEFHNGSSLHPVLIGLEKEITLLRPNKLRIHRRRKRITHQS